MPTYEYRCPKGHEFEAFQRITAEPVAKCPVCGEKAERLLSAGAGLLFKGSGFYITDYKKAGTAEKSGGGEKGGGESSGEKGGGEKGGDEKGGASGSKSKARDSGGSTSGSDSSGSSGSSKRGD